MATEIWVTIGSGNGLLPDENTEDIYCWNEFEIYLFETVVKSPRGQWVNVVARLVTGEWH